MHLEYADDVDIIGRSDREFAVAFSKFAEDAGSVGLAVYGAETSTITSSDEQALGVFERKIQRNIYGSFCDRREWRIRWNQELYDNIYTMTSS